MSEESINTIASPSGDSFWDPGNYKRATKRIEDGYKLSNDLIELVQERADAELIYAQNLKSWSKKWSDSIQEGPEYGTSRAAWKGFTVEAAQISQLHKRIKSDLINNVISSIHTWQKDNYSKNVIHLKEAKSIDEQFKKAQKQWEKELAKVKKAKQDYFKACKLEKSKEKNPSKSTGNNLPMKIIEGRFAKNNEGVQAARKNYEKSLQEIKLCIPSYMEDMRKVFDICQHKEAQRLQFFKDVLLNIGKCVSLVNKDVLMPVYEELTRTIKNADPVKDLEWWSNNYGLRIATRIPKFEEHPECTHNNISIIPEFVPQDQPDVQIRVKNPNKFVRFKEEITFIKDTSDNLDTLTGSQPGYDYWDESSSGDSNVEAIYRQTVTMASEDIIEETIYEAIQSMRYDPEEESTLYSSHESLIETDIDNFSELLQASCKSYVHAGDFSQKLGNISLAKLPDLLLEVDGFTQFNIEKDKESPEFISPVKGVGLNSDFQTRHEISSIHSFAAEMAQRILMTSWTSNHGSLSAVDAYSNDPSDRQVDIEMKIQPLSHEKQALPYADALGRFDTGKVSFAELQRSVPARDHKGAISPYNYEDYNEPDICEGKSFRPESEAEIPYCHLSESISNGKDYTVGAVETGKMAVPVCFELAQGHGNEHEQTLAPSSRILINTDRSVFFENDATSSDLSMKVTRSNEEINSDNSQSGEDSSMKEEESFEDCSIDGDTTQDESNASSNVDSGTDTNKIQKTNSTPILDAKPEGNQPTVKEKSVSKGFLYGETLGWSIKHVGILLLIILIHYGLYLLIKS